MIIEAKEIENPKSEKKDEPSKSEEINFKDNVASNSYKTIKKTKHAEYTVNIQREAVAFAVKENNNYAAVRMSKEKYKDENKCQSLNEKNCKTLASRS